MPNPDKPPFSFVLAFLLFSGIFFYSSYKLWFKTDMYYQDIYNSLARQPSVYPFREFFLKRMESKKRWVLRQKVFSMIGILAVLGADIFMITAWVNSH